MSTSHYNIILVGYMGFDGPGIMHLYHFAQELTRLGHRLLILIDGDPATVQVMAEPPAFPILRIEWEDARLAGHLLAAVEEFAPHLVHAWTPRHRPARTALEVAERTNAAIFIHYEDDEDYLYRYYSQRLGVDLLRDRHRALDSLAHPNLWLWQHPFVSPIANHYALAFTAICKPYVSRLEREWGKPVHLLYPGVDLQRFHPAAEPVVRGGSGLAGKTVLLYSGSLGRVHSFDKVLEAFARIAPRWPDTVLVQLGRSYVMEELDDEVRRLGLKGRVRFLGPIDHREIHAYLALGDIYLQSGTPGDFDEYRLPSKLPEYFAMGRPVVTFAHGIGREFEDGVDVLAMQSGDPEEMAACIERLLAEPDLRARLGQGGRRRAEELFSWPRNAAGLAGFYADVLANRCAGDETVSMRHWAAYTIAPAASPVAGPRRVLIVASDAVDLPGLPGGPTGRRATALAEASAAAGHMPILAMPAHACPESFDLRPWPHVRLWQPRTLDYVIERAGADGVILCGWPALEAFYKGPPWHIPAIADLAGTSPFAPGGPPPAECVAALARTRGAVLGDADERATWLPLTLTAGCRLIELPSGEAAGATAGAESLAELLLGGPQ